MSPGSLRDRALKIVSISAVEMPGVNASTNASYGRQAAGLAQQRRLVAHQVDHLFQVRGEQLEIVGLARLDPEDFGARGALARRAIKDGGVAMA